MKLFSLRIGKIRPIGWNYFHYEVGKIIQLDETIFLKKWENQPIGWNYIPKEVEKTIQCDEIIFLEKWGKNHPIGWNYSH
jgi:hypothetical protein